MCQRNITALAVVTVLLLCLTAEAQKRRRSRTSAVKPVIVSLTDAQKESVNGLLTRAKELEVTFKYSPETFADETHQFSRDCSEASTNLPEGVVKAALTKMQDAYFDAGLLYGWITNTGAMAPALKSLEKVERMKGNKPYNNAAAITERYGVEELEPYQAQKAILQLASKLRNSFEQLVRNSLEAR